MIRLKKWSVFSDGIWYTAPELCSNQFGKVYGHPKSNDSGFIDSSRIVKITDKGTHKEVETWDGSVFELYKEDVDPEYEKQFLNCYERLKLNTSI